MKSLRIAILFLCFFIVSKIYTYLEIINQCHGYTDYSKNGLTGYYYSHPHWRGEPFLVRIDKKIDFSSSKSEIFQNTQFSIKWIGIIDIPKTGTYTIGVGCDDSAWLYIDGRLVLANTGIHPFKKVSKKIILNRGFHLLELRYIQVNELAEIKLYPPGIPIPLKPSINPNILLCYHMMIFRQNVLFIILGLLLLLYSLSIPINLKLPLSIIVIIAIGGLFRFVYLGQVPGLHTDEAWAGLRALEIIDGMRPLSGLAFYTGPILHYMLATIFSLFGINVFTLRSGVALINTLNIILMYKLTNQLYSKKIGLVSALIFASIPWHIMYSRFVLEHTFLTIFFMLSSLYLLVKPNRKAKHICIAGFLMGLGVYNYLLFLTLPVSIIVTYIFYTKGKGLFKKELWLGIISFCIAYLPKLYDNYRMGINLFSFTGNVEFSIGDIMGNLRGYFPVFLQCLDGTLLYQRFCGTINKIPIPINSTLFLWSICLLFIGKKIWLKKNLLLLILFILNYGLVIFIAKTPYTRFFLIPLTLAIIIISTRTPLLIAIIVAFINIFYVYNNYTAQFLKTGGEPSLFTYANSMDTSNHFMETKNLYKYILEKGIKDVYTNDFLYMELEFWDAINKSARLWPIGDPSPKKNSWLIFYNGPSIYPLEDVTTYKYPKGKPIDLPDILRYKFRIYET